jgi:steroid 5-alpha reductase family enzyme
MNYYSTLAIVLFLYMTGWFFIAVIKKRNDVADIAWGIGFVVLSWISWLLSEMFVLPALVVTVLVTIWGSRLSWHIYKRNHGKPEDYRYAEWRVQWGKWFYLRSYVQVFLLQGVFLAFIISPVIFINHNTQLHFSLFNGIGFALWITGFLFESIGDAQLATFIKNPENKGLLMQDGLWRYIHGPSTDPLPRPPSLQIA